MFFQVSAINDAEICHRGAVVHGLGGAYHRRRGVNPENVSNFGSEAAGKNAISASNIKNTIRGLEINTVNESIGKVRGKGRRCRVGLVIISERNFKPDYFDQPRSPSNLSGPS
jgi:hypothetical protein